MASQMAQLKATFSSIETNRAAYFDHPDNDMFNEMKQFLKHCCLRRVLDKATEVPLNVFEEFYKNLTVDRKEGLIKSATLQGTVITSFDCNLFKKCFHLELEEPFDTYPTDAEILGWLNDIGYEGTINKISEYRKPKMPPVYNFLHYYIMRCLTGRIGSLEQASKRLLRLMYGVCNGKQFDYGYMIWENMLDSLMIKSQYIYQRFLGVMLDTILIKNPAYIKLLASSTPAMKAEVQYNSRFKFAVNEAVLAKPRVYTEFMKNIIQANTEDDSSEEEVEVEEEDVNEEEILFDSNDNLMFDMSMLDTTPPPMAQGGTTEFVSTAENGLNIEGGAEEQQRVNLVEREQAENSGSSTEDDGNNEVVEDSTDDDDDDDDSGPDSMSPDILEMRDSQNTVDLAADEVVEDMVHPSKHVYFVYEGEDIGIDTTRPGVQVHQLSTPASPVEPFIPSPIHQETKSQDDEHVNEPSTEVPSTSQFMNREDFAELISEEVQNRIKEFSSAAVTSIEDKFSKLDENHTERINKALEDGVASRQQNAESLKTMEDRVGKLEQSIQQLVKEQSELKQSVSKMIEEQKKIDDRCEVFVKKQDSIEKKVEGLKTAVENIPAPSHVPNLTEPLRLLTEAINKQNNDMDRRFKELEEKVETLKSQSETVHHSTEKTTTTNTEPNVEPEPECAMPETNLNVESTPPPSHGDDKKGESVEQEQEETTATADVKRKRVKMLARKKVTFKRQKFSSKCKPTNIRFSSEGSDGDSDGAGMGNDQSVEMDKRSENVAATYKGDTENRTEDKGKGVTEDVEIHETSTSSSDSDSSSSPVQEIPMVQPVSAIKSPLLYWYVRNLQEAEKDQEHSVESPVNETNLQDNNQGENPGVDQIDREEVEDEVSNATEKGRTSSSDEVTEIPMVKPISAVESTEAFEKLAEELNLTDENMGEYEEADEEQSERVEDVLNSMTEEINEPVHELDEEEVLRVNSELEEEKKKKREKKEKRKLWRKRYMTAQIPSQRDMERDRRERKEEIQAAEAKRKQAAAEDLHDKMAEQNVLMEDEYFDSDGVLIKKKVVEAPKVKITPLQKNLLGQAKIMIEFLSKPQTCPMPFIDPQVDSIDRTYAELRRSIILKNEKWLKEQEDRVKEKEHNLVDMIEKNNIRFVYKRRDHSKMDKILKQCIKENEVLVTRQVQRQKLDDVEETELKKNWETKGPASTSKDKSVMVDGENINIEKSMEMRMKKGEEVYKKMKLTQKQVFSVKPIKKIRVFQRKLFEVFEYFEIHFERIDGTAQIVTPQDFELMNCYDLEDLLVLLIERNIYPELQGQLRLVLRNAVLEVMEDDPFLKNELTGTTDVNLSRTDSVSYMEDVPKRTIIAHYPTSGDAWYEVFYSGLSKEKCYLRTDECNKCSDGHLWHVYMRVEHEGQPENLRKEVCDNIQEYIKGREFMRKVWKLTGPIPD